jgi:hypothetical protein
LLDINDEHLTNIFGLNNAETITLKMINPELTDINILCDAIKYGFEEHFSLKFNILSSTNLKSLVKT